MSVLKRGTQTAIKTKQSESKFRLPFGLKSPFKLFFILLLVGIGYYSYVNWQSWLENLDDRPIKGYAIVGKPNYTSQEDVLETITKMGTLKGFFAQDVSEIQQQLENIPWIKGAVVRKMWPNNLVIWLTEYEPVAIWNKSEFVTRDGTVFQLPMEKVKERQFPYLGGPNYQSTKVLETWNQIYADFKAKNLTAKGVTIDERGAWEVTLDNDVVLKLGRGEWQSKLDRFVTIYPQIEVPENKRLDYVDLRYSAGAAVGLADK